MIKIRIHNYLFLAISLLIVTVGAVVWFKNSSSVFKECDHYVWLNPQLRCQDKPTISKASYEVFKNSLSQKIEDYKAEGNAHEVAVYFRDLENGPTFGINENTGFVPASLLKVPTMLTIFKLAEQNPSLLSQGVVYDQSTGVNEIQTIEPENKLELGQTYSLDELVFRMIAFSDNEATNILRTYLRNLDPGSDPVLETYAELGLVNPADGVDDSLTAKSYAYIFRILYNASYLSQELSDKALEYLSYADYRNGLRRGLPDDTSIAHKFGERFLAEGNVHLHDCGIIYYPNNPYLLCVMTRADNFPDAADIISEISQTVYEEVNSRKN